MSDTTTGRVRNVSGVDRVTRQRLVLAGAAIEVPLDEVWGYTQQLDNWSPYDEAATEVHEFNLEVIAYLIAVEAEAQGIAPAVVLAEAGVEPAGNASRDEWAAYVIGADLASPEDLDGLGRDEIRDTYKTKD